MKNILISGLVAVIAIVASCNKDLGNYNYSEIDSLYLNGIPDTIDLTLDNKRAFISPEISSKNGEIKEDDLTFEWVAFDNSAANTTMRKRQLSKEKVLDADINLTPNTYKAYLSVKQISTGRAWTYPFVISMTGEFGIYGWMVLHDIDNKARLDFYEDDATKWNTYPKIYRDFNYNLKDANTGEEMELEGKPVSVVYSSMRDPIFSQSKSYVYVNTDKKSYKINQSDGYLVNDLLYNFRNETIPGTIDRLDYMYPFGGGASYGSLGNNLYKFYYTNSEFYGVPVNRNADNSIFRISDKMAMPPGSSLMHALIFDEDKKRFLKISYNTTYPVVISTPDAAFDAKDVKKDLVYFGHTRAFNQQAIALMKDNQGYHIARMAFTNTNGNFSAISMTNVTSILTNIDEATHFALDQQYGYLFYVANNTLYQYDIDAQLLKIVRNLGSRQVSMLKFQRLWNRAIGGAGFNNFLDRMSPVGYSLILGTYDESSPTNSGKIEFLRVHGLMGDLTTSFPAFEGIGKPVDITYLER